MAVELIRTCDLTQPVEQLHSNEQLKARSRFLRGNIAEGLEVPFTGTAPSGGWNPTINLWCACAFPAAA
jgi:hypothetical protein